MPKYQKNTPMFIDLNDFKTKHGAVDTQLEKYRDRFRKEPAWNPKIGHQSRAASRKALENAFYADHFQDRYRFAKIVLDHVSAWVDDAGGGVDLRMVTIAPKMFAVSEADSLNYDIRPLQRLVERALRGHDFFGMIEFGFYKRWLAVPTISWHVHLFTVGSNYKALNDALAKIRARHATIIDGWPSASTIEIKREELESRLLYTMKFPYKGNDPFPVKIEEMDTDGVFEKVPTGKIGQHKDFLRSGELHRMAEILSVQTLDKFMVAGGTGKAVRKQIAKAALSSFQPITRR